MCIGDRDERWAGNLEVGGGRTLPGEPTDVSVDLGSPRDEAKDDIDVPPDGVDQSVTAKFEHEASCDEVGCQHKESDPVERSELHLGSVSSCSNNEDCHSREDLSHSAEEEKDDGELGEPITDTEMLESNVSAVTDNDAKYGGQGGAAVEQEAKVNRDSRIEVDEAPSSDVGGADMGQGTEVENEPKALVDGSGELPDSAAVRPEHPVGQDRMVLDVTESGTSGGQDPNVPPPPPSGPDPDDEPVMTFEEFKKKMRELQGEQEQQEEPPPSTTMASLSNFASVDCGAKVIKTNPEAEVWLRML